MSRLRRSVATCLYRALLSLVVWVLLAATAVAQAATLTVRSTADTAGSSCLTTCTLRQAINASNATPAVDDVIEFDIAGAGPHMIAPATPLPQIDDTVTINGYSQPGATPNTLTDGDNASVMIRVHGANAGASVNGFGICAPGVVVRGLSVTGFAGSAFVIGNVGGVLTCATIPANTVIAGNFIGLAADGTTAAGNGNRGVRLSTGADVTIGGATPAARNLIGANGAEGVSTTTVDEATIIAGNHIGTDRSGLLDRGNAVGVALLGASSDVTVGGALPNLIAFNATGVRVNSTASGNTLLSNHFRANDMLAIDLLAGASLDGVTPNDPDDADTGANNLQNFPVPNFVRRIAGGLNVNATLDRPAGASALTFTIGVYANSACDASGNGEGERFLGTFPFVTANGSQQTIDFDLATTEPLPVGTLITLTATGTGGTSEFSACEPLDNPNALVVTNTNDSGAGSLRQVLNSANASIGGDTITFNIPGSGVHTIALVTGLPTINDAVTIDGYTQPGATPNTLATGDNAVINIRIDGDAAGNAPGFGVCASDVSIRGVSITRFARGVTFGQDALLATCAGVPYVNASLSGSFVGLAPDGSPAVNGVGVLFTQTAGSVGGSTPADRNVISRNAASGINVGTSSAVAIDNNLIGTDPSGTLDRGNGIGIFFSANAALVSTAGSAAPNLIRFNGDGIRVVSGTSRATFFANDIFGNDALGIDLIASGSTADGVTPNDADDADTGGNNLQNFPDLSSALLLGGTIRVSGSLDVAIGAPSQAHIFAFYSSAACEGNGNGEGELYLGSVARTTTNTTQSFVIDVPATAPLGSTITATATFNGNTSEFSDCVTLVDGDAIFKDSFE